MISYQPLRDVLSQRGISFRQLARDCNITSNATVALKNDKSVRLEVIIVICEYLNVPIEDVIKV